MALIAASGDGGIHPEVARSAEQGLLAAVVDCFAADALVTVPRLGSRNSTAVMRRLHDLLDEGEGRPLYLVDVCTRLGVSGRTLRTACAEHLGLGPHRFLWLRRMQLARQALIKADPRVATVTHIATEFGFWELGRFSVQYKWLFGEPPSATLGRRHA
jgi:AraC-like DNA-binding protein